MNQNPIRILHWGLFGGRGGIETFIMNLYRNMDRSRVQFDFLEDHNMGRFIYEDEIEQMGGRVFRVLYSQRENYKKSKSCFIDFLREHPEIVGVHVHANFLYAKLLIDAKKAGVPIRILHSHNSSCGDQQNVRQWLRNIIVRRQIAGYPSDYFACSDLAAEFMFPHQKYQWIKNGIDVKKYDFNETVRNRIRRQLEIENEIVVGFVGNLRTQKNPFYLMNIFKEFCKIHPASKLLVIGSGVLEQELRQYVSNQGMKDAVIFSGSVSNVEEMYQAMDVFLLPSLYEGLPIVLVEAQTSGLPCFVADNITRQIEVTENIRYLSLKKTPKEWAKEMSNMLRTFVRKSHRTDIVTAGFDIADVALEVQNYYLSHFKNREN